MSYTTLPRRMREAADTLEEASALLGYHSTYGLWNSASLRSQADELESEVPQ